VVVDDVARIGEATTAMLPSHARRRGVVLALHGRGPSPPWCSDRTVVDALVDALVAAGVPTRWTALGRVRAGEGALRRIAPCTADPRTLPLMPARLTLPRAWIGRHLVLVVPTVLDDDADRRGPCGAALAALAAAAGAGALADELALGAELVAEVFAGFTLVVDARHALLRPRLAGRRPQRLAVGRALVGGRTGASPDECRELAASIDAWLVARTAVRIAEPSLDRIALAGPCAADPWPAGVAEPVGVDGPLWPTHPRSRDRDARPA
jgi:hypothetical protein